MGADFVVEARERVAAFFIFGYGDPGPIDRREPHAGETVVELRQLANADAALAADTEGPYPRHDSAGDLYEPAIGIREHLRRRDPSEFVPSSLIGLGQMVGRVTK